VLNDLNQYNRKIRQDLLIEHQGLEFYTTWGLFSPRQIDDGSRMLLEFLDLSPSDHCLDLGCGYGVLGLCLAKMAPDGHILLVDKDFVAVEYAEKNRLHNRIENASCILSNGFNQVPAQQFDVIVSNIPAKVGKEMLYIYLFDALKYLKPVQRGVRPLRENQAGQNLHRGTRYQTVTVIPAKTFVIPIRRTVAKAGIS
jgi:16S rRNA G1207 methylase RsmC